MLNMCINDNVMLLPLSMILPKDNRLSSKKVVS